MKKCSLALLVLAGLSFNALAGDPAAGKSLTVTCSACHGQDGNSAVPTFPKLAGQNEKYLIKQMSDIKSGARPVPTMIGQLDNLNDEQIADIAAYFASQTMTPGRAADKDLALGAEVYRAGNMETGVSACAACHGATGAGNAPAGWPRLGGQYKEYLAAQLRKWRIGAEYTLKENPDGRTNDGDSRIMRDVAYRMTDREIDAVANFIAGLY